MRINQSRHGHFNTGCAFVSHPEADVVYLAHSGLIGKKSMGLAESFIRTFDTVLLNAGKAANLAHDYFTLRIPDLTNR